MNQKRKNIIIVVVLLLVTNLFTNYISSNRDAVLGKKTNVTVASVDGKEFSSNDIYKEWKSSGIEQAALTALLESVDKYIINDKYGKDKTIKSEADKQAEQIRSSYESQGTDFDETLASSGLTEKKWIEMLQQQIAVEKITKAYVEKTVTKEEVQAAYDAEGDKVKSSQILFKVVPQEGVATEEITKAASDEANAVYTELETALKDSKDQEATFAEFAKKYSQDEDTKDRGGNIGYSTGEDELYQTELDKLEVGQISGVVETNYGFAIIMKTDVKEKQSLDKKSVYKKYQKQIADTKIEEKKDAYSQVAMIEFRQSYGLKFKDTELGEAYTVLIDQSKTELETPSTDSTTQTQ